MNERWIYLEILFHSPVKEPLDQLVKIAAKRRHYQSAGKNLQ